MGPSLVWKLSDGFEKHYAYNIDKINVVNNSGSISVWLNNGTNEHLESTLILTYSPEFNGTDVCCNDESSKYIIAGILCCFHYCSISPIFFLK